jgi:hypothetical protein
MSGKLISVLVALGMLSSAAVALTVVKPDFSSFVYDRNYPAKADFDRTFAAFATRSASGLETVAADREQLRATGLKRMKSAQSNSAQSGEE